MEQGKHVQNVAKFLLLLFILLLCNSSVLFQDYILRPGIGVLNSLDSESYHYLHDSKPESKIVILFTDGLEISHNLTRITPASCMFISKMPATRQAFITKLATGFDPGTALSDYIFTYYTLPVYLSA